MAELTSAPELVRALGAEFDRRGWSDPTDLALRITAAVQRGGILDAAASAALADTSFLERNGISRTALRLAIETVFAGREYEETKPRTIDNSVTIGDNNKISAPVNAGGRQLVITVDSSPGQVLDALTEFTETALREGFRPRDLHRLEEAVDARGDLGAAALEQAAREGLERSGADQGRLVEFRDAVLRGASSGLVVQAILAALGALT
jgi:hypothetical protein